ncbi:Uncharacterised protein [[Clostridium] sordellii]|uniref:hypothetical protein n=1 Tax=Paraclostridium sordellii TaxID=1505 RepID=UPI0005E30C22|nr:hypothetical protein [Paeniclostridium sordellii]CEQ01601.1 Uncharacterised protein [[Clostridium] sordellii] [Paeniclostridium sordellii]
MGKLINRIGDVSYSKKGEKMTIVEYINNDDITVEFEDVHKTKIKTRYYEFKLGNIKNPNRPIVYNKGYLGVGKYKSIAENKKQTKCYDTWKGILRRGYCERYKQKHPAYKDVTVCEEWHNFQNFAKWYEENYYEVDGEKMCLDKDILVKGNKVYSPDTCVFVPQTLNNTFTKNEAIRGKLPIGCYMYNEKIKVQLSYYNFNTKKKQRKVLGYFEDKNDAFYTYKKYKEKYIKELANYYKNFIPKRLYESLLSYNVEIDD